MSQKAPNSRPKDVTREHAIEVHPILQHLVNAGHRPYIVDMSATRDVSANNLEFIVGSTTELNIINNGSYIKVDVFSSSTDDKNDAAGSMRSVKVWGVDRYQNIRVERIILDGVGKVSSSNNYYGMNGIDGDAWGTDGRDAKGNVLMGGWKTATEETQSISATKNHMDNCRLWIPKGWNARVIHGCVHVQDQSTGRSAGILIFPDWQYGFSNTKTDFDSSHHSLAFFTQGRSEFDENNFSEIYGHNSTISKLTWYGKRINTSETWHLHVRIALWPNKTLAESQSKNIVGDI